MENRNDVEVDEANSDRNTIAKRVIDGEKERSGTKRKIKAQEKKKR